jgi:hypothetical protein
MAVAELEPIAVYDCSEPGNAYRSLSFEGMRALLEWLKENEVPDADATERVEVYQSDEPYAVIYQIELDEQGRAIFVPEGDQVKRRDPFRVALTTLPPEVS